MLRSWKLKALVQKTLSFLPYPNRTNYFFQKYVTRGVHLDEAYFDQKLIHATDHFRFLTKYSDNPSGSTVLELGTGWYPIVPVYFFLHGCPSVISIDIQSWMKKENLLRTIRMFIEYNDKQKLQMPQAATQQSRWEVLKGIIDREQELSFEEILEKIHLQCLVGDAANLSLEDNSIDFIYSNNTFEHIKPDALKPILREFARVLNPVTGVMSHFIDMTDHFAHFDTAITVYNFLKYSRKRWRIINNDIQHLNRLRLVDYKKIYHELEIPVTEEIIYNERQDDLDKITVHREFSEYTKEELAVTHAYLISILEK